MKYFLDSAKLDEIQYAYNTFGIDGVTTNPRHIMLSGKPFMKAITDIAEWIKSVGLEGIDKFPVSVEINPHLDDADEMIEMAKKVAALQKTGEDGNPYERDACILTGTGQTSGEKRFPLRIPVHRMERGQWRRLQGIHKENCRDI